MNRDEEEGGEREREIACVSMKYKCYSWVRNGETRCLLTHKDG